MSGEVPRERQCTMPSCAREARDPSRPGSLCGPCHQRMGGGERGADPAPPDAGAGASTTDADEWAAVDFATVEPDVWPPAWEAREMWMAAMGKQGFAPWAARDHPDVAADEDARWKWSLPANWADKATVDEWVDMDPRLDGHVAIIEKPGDPYTDDPDPFAFVDGDDVRDPGTGAVHPGFVAILEDLGLTYADVSTSGSGVHAIYEGTLPEDVKQAAIEIDDEPWGDNDEPPTVEFYDGKHLCVTTGDHVAGTPVEVREWDADALAALLEDHLDEADRHREVSHDTDRESPDMAGFEPAATGADETTSDVRDVFAAVDRLTPRDLGLQTLRQGEDATGWTTWDPSPYRHSEGRDSVHSPDERRFYDHKTGHSFGLLSYFAAVAVDGTIATPWQTLAGDDWWAAVEAARERGAPIPEYEPDDAGAGEWPVETCAPPVQERTAVAVEERWDHLQGERFEDYLAADGPVIWADPPGLGKTTNAAIAAAERDRDHAVLFAEHAKAREFATDDPTPDDYYHLKGAPQPRADHCMDAAIADDDCPEHGDADCPSMCPIYDRPADDDRRELFERVATEVGPVRAHLILDLHGGHECPYLRQFEAARSEERIVGVHEYATLSTVTGARDTIIDEKPGLLASGRSLDVEALTRATNLLHQIAEVGDSPTTRNAGALADFVEDCVALITDPGTPTDLAALDPPSVEPMDQWDERRAGGEYVWRHEALARLKLSYTAAVLGRMTPISGWEGTPLCMDALITAAVEAGLDPDVGMRAVAAPMTLDVCPSCGCQTVDDEGSRVCPECYWHEDEDPVCAHVERARASAEIAVDREGTPRALAYRALPLVEDLPERPLILDATATPERVECLWQADDVAVVGDEAVAANMHVTQIVDGQYHRGTILDEDFDADRFQRALDTATDVHDRVLVVGPQQARSILDLPDEAEYLHYHALRGKNRAEYDAVLVLGASHPDVEDLRRDARLLAMHADDVRVGGTEHSTRRGAPNPPVYRKLDYVDDAGRGRAIPTKHYTGLVGDLFRATRENEIEQAIHRLRPVLADEADTKHVYLLTNVPTDVPVDEVASFEDLVDPIRAVLPVADRAIDLLEIIHDVAAGEGPDGFRAQALVDHEDGELQLNRRGIHRLANVAGMDVTYKTICTWVEDLQAIGLLEPGEYEHRAGVLLYADRSTLKQALSVLSNNAGFKVAALRRLRRQVDRASGALDWLAWATRREWLTGERCDLGPPPDPVG